jgi:hypothetical protein
MSYPPAHELTTYRGHTVDQRTKYLLGLVEKELGFGLYCYQGSPSTSVAASAGTHSKKGVVDVSTRPLNSSTPHAYLIVKTLRKYGFAAWHRTPSQGPWGEHIHAVDCGGDIADGARWQVEEYRAGRNGLASRGLDDGPKITLRARAYPPVSALPYVSLANVRNQAIKGGTRRLRGVRRIQRALNAKYGADLVVDGLFGPKTKRVYGQWETHIGGDGDGLPAKFSLTKLGEGRFRVRLK